MTRKRQDRKRNHTSSKEEKRSPCLGVNTPGAPYQKLHLTRMPSFLTGYTVKGSSRWGEKSKPLVYTFPFIEKKGHITPFAQAEVHCEPQQLIATVVATVANRIRTHCIKFNERRVVGRAKQLITRLAYYYSLTRNDWFLDRVLFLSRELAKNKKQINHLLAKFLTQLDDYKRFVYSQVVFQTNWLFTRALRPRDKSKFFLYSDRDKLCSSFRSSGWRWRAWRETARAFSLLSPIEVGQAPVCVRRVRWIRLTPLGRALLSDSQRS